MNDQLSEQMQWHDSKLLSVTLMQERNVNERPTFTVYLTVDAISFPSNKSNVSRIKKLRFLNCWAFGTNLNLAYLATCGGAISRAQFVSRFADFHIETQDSIKKLGLSQSLIEGGGHFFLELIQPAGIIAIGADDFDLADNRTE